MMLTNGLRLACRKHGFEFEKHKLAVEEGAGRDESIADGEHESPESGSRPTSINIDEKKSTEDA